MSERHNNQSHTTEGHMLIDHGILYVIHDGTLCMIDVRNPAAPVLLSTISLGMLGEPKA
jgi:hypothetical protein